MDATSRIRDATRDEAPTAAERVGVPDDYRSDVTPEKVALMRERARTAMEGDEWEQVDGFGTASHS